MAAAVERRAAASTWPATPCRCWGSCSPCWPCALILGRIGVRCFRGLAAGATARAASAWWRPRSAPRWSPALAWAWWPHPGSYRPIEPGERGALRVVPAGAAAPSRPPTRHGRGRRCSAGDGRAQRSSSDAPLVAAFQEGASCRPGRPGPRHGARPGDEADERAARPSRRRAQPDRRGARAGARRARTEHESARRSPSSAEPDPDDDAWVFPFDQPLPPDEGDNQALAVNTTDDSVTYDVAFALVWAEDDEVLNVNEAHAYASCSDCVAVAVAFQVVLIMDDAQVVVPQNLAVAANYDCYRCITAAIASQLVLSVQERAGRGGAAGPGRGVEPAARVRAARSRRTRSPRSPPSSRPSRPRSSRSSGRRRRSSRVTRPGPRPQPRTAATRARPPPATTAATRAPPQRPSRPQPAPEDEAAPDAPAPEERPPRTNRRRRTRPRRRRRTPPRRRPTRRPDVALGRGAVSRHGSIGGRCSTSLVVRVA